MKNISMLQEWTIHVTPTMHFTVRMESALGKNGAAMEKTIAGTGAMKQSVVRVIFF